MATLRELKQCANKWRATVIIGDYNPYDQSTTIEVEAPDGKQWADGNCQYLLDAFYSYDKDSRYEAYGNLIERMGYGLEDYND